MNDSKKIDKDKVMVYLMDNGNFIIGEDAGKHIKNALRFGPAPGGQIGLVTFYKAISGVGIIKKVGCDIDKRTIHIIDVIKPYPVIADQYIAYIETEGAPPKIEVPKQNMN
jgi:hypothetical protein